MAKQEELTMIEFMRRFGTEEACREHLYAKKWPEGFKCPRCGEKDEPFKIVSRNKYQCRHCSAQTSVTAGTIMDKTRTDLTKWFLAIYLMSTDKRGCSALRLKRELHIAYDTAWTISHKIRHAMGERNKQYTLDTIVDMDESFFGAAQSGGKRGRGATKTAVIFALSRSEKGKSLFLKATVVERVDTQSLKEFALENIQSGSVIRSDGLNLYPKLTQYGFQHDAHPSIDRFTPPEVLQKLHVIIANAKAFILGTYHGLEATHLQAFLDEFTFRFNRRAFVDQLFNRTVSVCLSSSPFPRYALVR